MGGAISTPSASPQVPRPLVEVIDRCLRSSPDDRYATGEALAEALGQALEKAAATSAGGQPDRIIATGQAEAIWLRAAQLQADAASRLEQRSRLGTGLTGIAAALPSGGYRLRDVEAAAQEVGIAPEFVALALAEQPAQAAVTVVDATARQERMTTRLLGTSERSISVSRVIRGSPRTVLEAIGRVCPARPYLMSLRDTVGGHPLDGGVMVFTIPNMMKNMMTGSAELYTSFTYRMYQLELFQLNVTLRPLAAGGGCEVTVYGDLRPCGDGWHRRSGGRGWRTRAGRARGASGRRRRRRARWGQPALVSLALSVCAAEEHRGARRDALGR
jgi:hypothetical protein